MNDKNRAKARWCYTRRYSRQPGLWETYCGALVIPLTSKCPFCGKPTKCVDTFDSADEELAYLRHACEWYMKQILRSYRSADAWMKLAEQRKQEVQMLQEACRKHRQKRREYWAEAERRGKIIAGRNRLVRGLQSKVDRQAREILRMETKRGRMRKRVADAPHLLTVVKDLETVFMNLMNEVLETEYRTSGTVVFKDGRAFCPACWHPLARDEENTARFCTECGRGFERKEGAGV